MLMLAVSVQPLLSVKVTVYVPAATPVMDAVVAEFDQLKVYGIVPPLPEAEAPPFENPLQLTLLSKLDDALNTVGSVIVVDDVDEQPLASVTVTVKVPVARPVMLAVVAELLQL